MDRSIARLSVLVFTIFGRTIIFPIFYSAFPQIRCICGISSLVRAKYGFRGKSTKIDQDKLNLQRFGLCLPISPDFLNTAWMRLNFLRLLISDFGEFGFGERPMPKRAKALQRSNPSNCLKMVSESDFEVYFARFIQMRRFKTKLAMRYEGKVSIFTTSERKLLVFWRI